MTKLSIIITHHKTPELLDLCLKSIKENINGLSHEIIVVDSESIEQNTALILEKHLDIKFIPFKKNYGYSKIVNAGIKESKGEYILILNADIIILDKAISKLIDYLEKNPKTGIVAPQLIDFTNNIQASCFSQPKFSAILARRTPWGKTKAGKEALNKFTIAEWDRKSIKEVDWAQGSAMMVRKSAIDKVGLWDERFFMYFEDADLCRRFWENNFKVVYLPEAKMAHYYHRSSKKWGSLGDLILNKYTRTHIISAFKYFIKYKNKSKIKT